MLTVKDIIWHIHTSDINFTLNVAYEILHNHEVVIEKLVDSRKYENWDWIFDVYGDRLICQLEWDDQERVYHIWIME